MNIKLLISCAWILWSVSLLGLLFIGLRIMTERGRSPEAGNGLGLVVLALVLVLLLALGGGIYWAAKRQSVVALVLLSLVPAYVLTMLVAGPIITGFKRWRWQSEESRAGDFRSEPERSLADAIARNDATRLKELLSGQPPPEGRDQAGLNLLEFTVVAMCDRDAGLNCLRALLEAGATARDTKGRHGEALITALLLSYYHVPQFREAMALLLEHGADVNQRDPVTGRTALLYAGEFPDVVRLLVERGADVESLDEYGQSPVVRFTGLQHWEAAQFLVEHGVRLDLATSDGLSLDYYLDNWKDSVYGEHPEGWDSLRAAIAKRRKQTDPSTPTKAKRP
ncbi:MAG: hypothetical protein KJT03_06480 [Verrucomicrobiae bacterium]|nr:hypothetical protein [Verrucomicrobiae bacterium]